MAVFLGIGPVLLASTISALVWNYFFIPPHHALHIEKTEDKLMFVSFFIIALLNGILTNRIRRQEKLGLDREERTNAIFELTRELSKTSGIEDILQVASREIKKYFDTSAICFFREKENALGVQPGQGNDNVLSGADLKIAEWVFKNSSRAGKYTELHTKLLLHTIRLQVKISRPE